MNAASRPPGSLGGLFAALRLSSATSLVTTLFGVASNKILATVAGVEGVALVGLYRALGMFVCAVLPLGTTDVTTRRISIAKERAEVVRLIEAVAAAFLVQAAVVLIAGALLGGVIARLLFGVDAAPHVWEVRCMMAVAVVMLLQQAGVAVLNGLAAVRGVALVMLATSVATLLTTYPFLRLGTVGVPLVVGGTCVVGAAVAMILIWRSQSLRASELALPPPAEIVRRLTPSLSLVLQPIVVGMSTLLVQSLVTRGYGLDGLGNYNAAALIEGTSIMVLMSSMRSYYLPMLGRTDDYAEKRQFALRTLSLQLVLLLAGGSILIFGAPMLIPLLYSHRFGEAVALMPIVTLSMPAQVFVWCSAMFLLHKADYVAFLCLDGVWACLRVAATFFCVRHRLSLADVVWTYVATYTLSALFYSFVIARRHGGALIGARGLMFGAAVLAVLGFGAFVAAHPTGLGGGVFVAGAVLCGLSISRYGIREPVRVS